jgi:hypothetical protein
MLFISYILSIFIFEECFFFKLFFILICFKFFLFSDRLDVLISKIILKNII